MFQISESIFRKASAVESVELEMPNIHYFVADLTKINIPNSGEVSYKSILCHYSEVSE